MSNIGWHRVEIQKQAKQPTNQPVTEKIPYIPALKNKPNSTESEKESVRLWNLMQSTLYKNGLMEEKKD